MPVREDSNEAGGASSASPSKPTPPPPPRQKQAKAKRKKKDDDLSEEDQELKEKLELYVLRAQDSDPGVQKLALESMRQEICTATSSMMSIPMPLKFLRPHYGTLKAYFETMTHSDIKRYMADILSVLALTMSVEGERESLNYRMMGSESDIGSWGHQYVRNLADEIAQEFQKRLEDDVSTDSLMELAQQIVSFHMKHNAESEAVDLVMEVSNLNLLTEHVDTTNYKRACLYLTSYSRYCLAPDNMLALEIVYNIYLKFGELARALQIALLLDNQKFVKQVYTTTDDLLLKKQLSYIIARHVSKTRFIFEELKYHL